MNRPMRVYGFNVFEEVARASTRLAGWFFLAASVVPLAASGWFAAGTARDLLLGSTFVSALVLLLGSGGVRQNRSALRMGCTLTGVASLAWIGEGALLQSWLALGVGGCGAVLTMVNLELRKLGLYARFQPRFFSQREFETMLQVADVLIEGDGRAVMTPIQIAVNADHALAKMSGPSLAELKQVLFVTEWLAPLFMLGLPVAFSDMGTHERRAAIERLISKRGIFRDIARGLKVLACLGYYGSTAGMASVHYVPFEERPRGQADQTPKKYPLPTSEESPQKRPLPVVSEVS